MFILGINTATEIAALALVKDHRLLAEVVLAGQPAQAESLILEIKKLLDFLKLKFKDVELISAVAGPGSFTGLRLGLTTAKTLAQINGQKIVLVDSLENLAWQARHSSGLLFACLKASRDLYNVALFALKDGQFERLTEDLILTEEALVKKLSLIKEKFYLAGGGQDLCDKICQVAPGSKVKFLASHVFLNAAASAAWLGYQKYLAGNFEKNILKIAPFYLHAVKIIKKDFQYDRN